MVAKAHHKILVVEDCASDVFFIRHMLEAASGVDDRFDIIDVPRLVDAFYLVRHDVFDAVLLDLNLADIDGVAAVAALHAEIPETPIIVYSGMADDKLKGEALLCGASDYLIKGRESSNSFRRAIENCVVYQPKFIKAE